MKLETQTEQFISETVTVYGLSPQIGVHALAQTVNALAAQGAVFSVCPDIAEDEEQETASGRETAGQVTDIQCEDVPDTHEPSANVSVQIAYPEYVFKSRIHKIEKLLKKACKKYNINLDAVQASANPAVQVIAVTVTGIAKAPKEEAWNRETARACKDIVFVGYAGMDGMLRITEEKEQELKTRFAPVFLKQILSYGQQIFALREIEAAKAGGAFVVRQVADGGILAALWNLALELEQGLDLDMKKINILQETIEVCEHFRLNPYQMISTGSFLAVTDNGEVLADALNNQGITAAVIGHTTDNNDKILRNGEEMRYIDRPAPDEILKLYSGGMNDGRIKKADTPVSGEA